MRMADPEQDRPAPTTAKRLAIARRAHADALALAQQAQQGADAAQAALRKAETHRWHLVDKPGTGSPAASALAKIAITEAQGAVKHVALVAAGAIAEAERAEIAALHAAADHLQAGYDAAAGDSARRVRRWTVPRQPLISPWPSMPPRRGSPTSRRRQSTPTTTTSPT